MSDSGHQTARFDGGVQPPSTELQRRLDTPNGFIEWFGNNYSGEVYFSDPAWHARIIFRNAMWWGKRMPEPSPAASGNPQAAPEPDDKTATSGVLGL
jgi:hypothetical protein